MSTAESTVGAQPGESAKQRVDRELVELLQEIRVALPGLELLFGFLLILPFTDRFEMITGLQRTVYLACFVTTAASAALMIAPTARHRIRFREVDKEVLLRESNRQVIAGAGQPGDRARDLPRGVRDGRLDLGCCAVGRDCELVRGLVVRVPVGQKPTRTLTDTLVTSRSSTS